MKQVLLSFVIVLFFCVRGSSQPVTQMPVNFDVVKENIPHGKIDTITYTSKTVGTARRALIYTPPGYSKKKKYPVLYLLHGIRSEEHSLNSSH